jgi:ABC-type uncharacterized transport system permease subunit
MLEWNIMICGIIVHLLCQLALGVFQKNNSASRRILGIFAITFVLTGIGITLFNSFGGAQLDQCGTEVFNGLTTIALLGNIGNLIVYVVSLIVLRIAATLFNWD